MQRLWRMDQKLMAWMRLGHTAVLQKLGLMGDLENIMPP